MTKEDRIKVITKSGVIYEFDFAEKTLFYKNKKYLLQYVAILPNNVIQSPMTPVELSSLAKKCAASKEDLRNLKDGQRLYIKCAEISLLTSAIDSSVKDY